MRAYPRRQSTKCVLIGCSAIQDGGAPQLLPVRGEVSAFPEHLSLSVPRTEIGCARICAGKMEGALGRLEFSPRAAQSLAIRAAGCGEDSVP